MRLLDILIIQLTIFVSAFLALIITIVTYNQLPNGDYMWGTIIGMSFMLWVSFYLYLNTEKKK